MTDSHFAREIAEQPEVLERILADEALTTVAAELRQRQIRLVLTLARGSSDNAVTFFTYLAGLYLGLPVASVPPSLLTLYQARLQLDRAGNGERAAEDTLVIGVSQSGESPDVVAGLKALRDAGARTLAITNREGSALTRAADFALLQRAGEERAVAASKTFSSQLLLLACLVANWADDADLDAALRAIPAQMRALLAAPAAIERAALRLTHAESAFVLGRGLGYAAALELALKLKETSYLHAQAYSSAEFQHGPIASLEATDPVLLLALQDPTLGPNLEVAERLRELGADLTVIAAAPELLASANAPVPLPDGLHPVTGAFLQVLAGQLLALYLATSKGLDPDAPRHISKVTRTL